LPSDFGAPILVVVHTSAVDGHLAEVLNRSSLMKTVRAEQGMPILQGHIYVAPPDHHLTVSDATVVLSTGPKINRHRPAIDPLFESAAKIYGNRLLAIVLTGYLDDGTAGLAAVKAQGGTTVVQDPEDAVVPNMPKNALAHTRVDYCVPLAEIAPLLVRLVGGEKDKA
jgi:two-component system, chemotaxis family, protein-glutamate methylesterase/glutaminase